MSGIKIDPDSYYNENQLRIMGFDGDLLEEAREAGRLRFRQLSEGLVMYKGCWVMDWLDQVESVPAAKGDGR